MIKLNERQSIAGGVIAFVIATSCCWLPVLAIALGATSGVLGMDETLEEYSLLFMLISVFFLGWGVFKWSKNRKQKVILFSTITCPFCGYGKEEKMPENACQFFYECKNCKKIMKPHKGDCCVFCSYGTVDCPPIRKGQNCCD